MSRFIDCEAGDGHSDGTSESISVREDDENEVYTDSRGRKHYIQFSGTKPESRDQGSSGGYPDESEDEIAHVDEPRFKGGLSMEGWSASLTKPEKKLIKGFCSRLLLLAASGAGGLMEVWEEHELGRLIALMQLDLQLSERKLVKLLRKSDLASPTIIACVRDAGVAIGSASIIHLITNDVPDRVIIRVDEALEQGLIATKDLKAMTALYEITLPRFSLSELVRLLRALCDHCKSKRHFGRVMNIFAAHFTDDEAAAFIQRVVSTDGFVELEGTVDDFIGSISQSQAAIRGRLEAMFEISVEGKIIDSDEDDKGNLKDFVVSDKEDENDYYDDSQEEEEELLSDDEETENGSEGASTGTASGYSDGSSDDDYRTSRRKQHSKARLSVKNRSPIGRRSKNKRGRTTPDSGELDEDSSTPVTKRRTGLRENGGSMATSAAPSRRKTASPPRAPEEPSPQVIVRSARSNKRIVCSDSED